MNSWLADLCWKSSNSSNITLSLTNRITALRAAVIAPSLREMPRPRKIPFQISKIKLVDLLNVRNCQSLRSITIHKSFPAGKKTFESLFSKVKAKIQEYDKLSLYSAKPFSPNLCICRPNKGPEEPNLPSWGAEPSPGTSTQRWSYNSGSQQQPPYHEPTPSVTVIPSSSLAPTGKPVHPYDIGVEQDAGPGSIIILYSFPHCLDRHRDLSSVKDRTNI